MNQSTALKANVGFGLILALIVGIACLSYRGAGRLKDAARTTERGYEVLSCLGKLDGQLKEAQSIQSAYAATRSQPLADRFSVLTAEIGNNVTLAAELTRGNKAQSRLKAVSPVVKARLRITGENPQVLGWLRTQIATAQRDQEKLLQALRKAEETQASSARNY